MSQNQRSHEHSDNFSLPNKVFIWISREGFVLLVDIRFWSLTKYYNIVLLLYVVSGGFMICPAATYPLSTDIDN